MSALAEPLLAAGYALLLVGASHLGLAWSARASAEESWSRAGAATLHRAIAVVAHTVALVLLLAALARGRTAVAAGIVAVPVLLSGWGLLRHVRVLLHTREAPPR